MSQGSCSAVTWYEPIRLVYNKLYNHLRRRASRPLFLFDYTDVVDFRFLFRIELFNITNMDRWYILLKIDKFVLVENGKDFDRITSIKPVNDRGSLKVSSTYAKSFLYIHVHVHEHRITFPYYVCESKCILPTVSACRVWACFLLLFF